MVTDSLAPASSPLSDGNSASWGPRVNRWLLVFLLLGLGWRLLRYLLQFPIWGDEAYLCLNFLNQDYGDLLKEVKHAITAPLLFLFGELTMYRWFGAGELVVRLLPALAGLAGLLLFWRLARRILDPLAATLAVGILAVSYYPVRHSCEVRPYSLDLLVAVLLLLTAIAWLYEPRRLRLMILLCVLLPLALGVSNTSVFIAGGISLALAPTVWRQPRKVKIIWLTYNLILGLSFLGYLSLNTHVQSQESFQFLQSYWASAFPPKEPLALLKWLVITHTSNMMAYPVGGKNFGSLLTFLLFIGGIWALLRRRQGQIVFLLLAPFGLTFIAAWIHRYPYGDSARVCQHLAPAICLLTAAGLASLIAFTCRTLRSRNIGVAIACFLIVAVGMAGLVRDLIQPFKFIGDQEGRRIVAAIADQAGPHCPIVLLNDWHETQPEFVWYLFTTHPESYWQKDVNWQSLAQAEHVCLLQIHDQHHSPAPPTAVALQADRGCPWSLTRQEAHSRPLDYHTGIIETIEVSEFQCDSVSPNNRPHPEHDGDSAIRLVSGP